MTNPASLTPIKRDAVPLAVARALQAYIAGQALGRADRLPSERELASSLGVSRPALREGIKYLTALDVLTVRQGSGVFVVQPQHPALTHIGQLGSRERLVMLRQATLARRLIDVEIAGRAAERASPGDVVRLRGYIAHSLAEPLATLREHQLDFGFEALIGELTGDPYLQVLQRQAHRLFQDAWEGCGLIPRPVEERNAQHRRIANAIEARDVARARRSMVEHFELLPLTIAAADETVTEGEKHENDTA